MQPSPSRKNLRPAGMVTVFVFLAASLVAAIYGARNWGATAAARRLKNPVPATTGSLAAGQQTYREHCQSCHGEKGDGRGEKAAQLAVAPGDFTDTQKMAGITDGELFWQITKGRLPMPAFAGKLSEQKRWQVVDYIRTFAGPAPQNPALPQ